MNGIAFNGKPETTDVSGLVRVVNEFDIGIGFGSFGGATIASLTIGDVGGMLNGQFKGLDEGGLVGNFAGQDLFISYQAGNGNDIALYTVSAVPEPASCLALILMATMGCFRRQRKV